jgi:hypothetical protein
MKWVEFENSLINIKNIESVDIIKTNPDRIRNSPYYDSYLKQYGEPTTKYFIKITKKENKQLAVCYVDTIEEAIENFDKISNFLKNDERVLKL